MGAIAQEEILWLIYKLLAVESDGGGEEDIGRAILEMELTICAVQRNGTGWQKIDNPRYGIQTGATLPDRRPEVYKYLGLVHGSGVFHEECIHIP